MATQKGTPQFEVRTIGSTTPTMCMDVYEVEFIKALRLHGKMEFFKALKFHNNLTLYYTDTKLEEGERQHMLSISLLIDEFRVLAQHEHAS